jgi:hypothetical protein
MIDAKWYAASSVTDNRCDACREVCPNGHHMMVIAIGEGDHAHDVKLCSTCAEILYEVLENSW